MKIAFIGQKGIPAKFGGVERHVEELAARMAKEGHQVFAYVRNNYTDKNLRKHRGVNLIHLPSIPTKHLDAISHTFLATIHSLFQDYDVIHYQAIGPSSLSWIIKLLKRETVLVSTFHCQDYYHQKWGWLARKYLRFSERLACEIPDKVIAVGETLCQRAAKKYEVSAELIPNGSKANVNFGNEALIKWNLKDKKYILFVGRLIKHKGVHYLIEAFKQMEDTNKVANNFKLVVVGGGFYTDDYVKYLKTISENRDNIIFTGNQTGKILSQLFSHAYLFVQPSESEGMSIALLEAMGYGIAPLVSDIKENLEAVGKAGFSFEAKNINDLKNKLAYLLNRESEVEIMGKKARKRAEEKFSWESIVKKTIQVYRDLAVGKKSK